MNTNADVLQTDISLPAGVTLSQVRFSPWQGYLAVLTDSLTPQVTDCSTGKLCSLSLKKAANRIAFRPPILGGAFEKEAAFTGSDGVTVINLESGLTVKTLELEKAFAVSYSPDGHLLAAGSENGTVCVWNLRCPGCPRLFSADIPSRQTEGVAGLCFNAFRNRLTITTMQAKVYTIDIERCEPDVVPFFTLDTAVDGADFQCYSADAHSSENFLALGGFGGRLVLSPANADLLESVSQVGAFIRQIACSWKSWQFTVLGPDAVEIWQINPVERISALRFGPQRQGKTPVVAAQLYPGQLHLARLLRDDA